MPHAVRSPTPADLGLPSVFRPSDIAAHGASEDLVVGWCRQGIAERVARGLYRRTDAEISAHETLKMVATAAPKAVFCLGTALLFHGIGTQAPPQVWIGLPAKTSARRIAGLPVRVVWFSEKMLRIGVAETVEQGVTLRVTSPARTVVDCVRYRNKIGIDVAIEALRDALRDRRVTVDELMRMAEMCGATTALRAVLPGVLA